MAENNNKEDYQLVLIDEHGTVYTEDEIRMMWPDFDGKGGNKRFPKIWEYNEDGTVKTEGATVAISYLNNDPSKPMVTGCIENLGSQQNYMPGMGTRLDTLNAETNINDNEDFCLTRTVSPDGDMFIQLRNKNNKPINYHLNVEGNNSNIYINSGGNTYIGNNHNQIQFDGNKIFIGSKLYSGKADEVGINAKRVILGNSTFYNPVIKTDALEKNIKKSDATDKFRTNNDFSSLDSKIQHQSAVMGETLVHLLAKMIHIWRTARYVSGNTVCKVLDSDRTLMENEVYNKLPRMLSTSISLINDSDDPKANN